MTNPSVKGPNKFGTHALSRGFTLIELMVAMLISVFLIGGVLLMAFSSRAASIETEHLSRVQENIRFTSDFLVRELRNAGFRDEISLRIDMFNEFASPGFAVVSNGGREITIRMSGARTCGNESRASVLGSLVTNRYSVENGNLICRGTIWIPDPDPGEDPVEVFPAVTLAGGIREILFIEECPSGTGAACTCSLWNFGSSDLEEEILDAASALGRVTCDAVRINLTFDGPGGADGTNPVEVQLRAAFRNIVLGRLQWASIP